MPDREKVIKEYEDYVNSYISLTTSHDYEFEMHKTVLALLKEQQQQIWELQDQVEYLTDKLKEQKSLLGIQQTADGITFISTGTAQQGEVRGIVLGQARMHEWLEKELLYRGLLTDAIRAVFHDARRLVK